jgi:hypothetical protein
MLMTTSLPSAPEQHGQPNGSTLMDEARKRAYRQLLYWAMLDIRPVAWLSLHRRWLPFVWPTERQQISRAGFLADWLHNLAASSALDFERFSEEWFWRDHETACRRHADLTRYRRIFEMWLATPLGEVPSADAWAAAMSAGGP